MRILAIDYGEKRIGIAISDPSKVLAHAVEVIERTGDLKKDLNKIAKILERYHGVEEIIIGLPKTLRGGIGIKAEAVLKFAEDVKKEIGVPVQTWDERLSTKAVERPLKEAHISKTKRKKLLDASAAAFMLQGYLDRKRHASS